jgi:hypothetical protein
MLEQIPMFDEPAPVAEPPAKETTLQKQILRLMEERGIKEAVLVNAIGVPWGTWIGWRDGEVSCPMPNENLRRLYKYLNVHLEYLIWGDGDGGPIDKETA